MAHIIVAGQNFFIFFLMKHELVRMHFDPIDYDSLRNKLVYEEKMNTDELFSIVNPPSNSEIKSALFAMKPLKAPGSDGFHPIFFQAKWETISDHVCDEIRDWFRNREIPESLGHALICLIPKQDPPETVKHLRPISLCNTLYKLVTKILVNRLKPWIPEWISPNQNSFIKGRGPKVNLVVASEILHSMHKKKGKTGWFALKVDLEKAYDRMEWSFVRKCLDYHNLDIASINLIVNCISKASSSVLVNGKKTESFTHSRGLRQGDPMSPYIFNMCFEQLTSLINLACEKGDWTPFWVGKKRVKVSHLLFKDDLLLFGKVDESTTFAVRDIMTEFGRISGQKVNENKSRLVFSPNTQEELRELYQSTINVQASENLGIYLGLPLSHKRPNKNDLQFVVEKVRKKLASWKTTTLCRASRLVLVRSTLNTIPNYYMQAYAFPTSIHEDLDRICNNFLWGSSGGKNRLHLVSKNATFRPKNMGGMGIREHATLNKTLMAKLGWKMCQGPPSLATECVQSKYLSKNGITSFRNGSRVWQSIGKGWPILESSCQWYLGDGYSVSFWDNNWLGVGPIRKYVIGSLEEKEASLRVRDCWGNEGWKERILSIDLPTHILLRIFSYVWTPLDDPDNPFPHLS